MPMLQPQRYALGTGKKTEDFNEKGNEKSIDNRALIRGRPNGLSGIPSPSAKKPLAVRPKPSLNLRRGGDAQSGDLSVAERNRRNQEDHSPVSGKQELIKQYQAAPKLIKQAVAGANVASKISKLGSRLPHKISSEKTSKAAKPPKGKPPSPPPRSKKPAVISCASAVENEKSAEGYSPNGTPLAGNGLGGGSIPQKGFSYIKPNSGLPVSCGEKNSKSLSGLKAPLSSLPEADKDQNQTSVVASTRESSVCDAVLDSTKTQSDSCVEDGQSKPLVKPNKDAKPVAKPSPQLLSVPKPSSRLPVKHDTEVSAVPNPTAPHSNIKPSSSPIRRATIHGSGGSASYCRGGKPRKGQQLKAVSIPKVPTDTDLRTHVSNDASAESLTSTVSAPDLTSSDRLSSVTDELRTKDKERRGLFGFARLVTGRSSFRSTESGAKTPPQKDLVRKTAPSNPCLQTAAVGDECAPSNELPPPGKTETADQDLDKLGGELNADNVSNSSSLPSDRVSSHSAPPGGLVGVLKNGILTKSASSSSILSDSAGSSLSNAPSLKAKKVSFQDDITVCDANGISTYSNGLRYSEVDRAFDQSLSSDVTEHVTTEQNYWPRAYELSRVRPSTPGAERLGASQYRARQDYSPRAVHQSAVAAAIQSISARSPVLSANGWGANGDYPRSDGFASSYEPPFPSTRYDRRGTPHKEDWNPIRRSASSGVNRYSGDFSAVAPSPCNAALSQSDYVKTGEENEAITTSANNYSYFETDRTPPRTADPIDNFSPDPVPYYECCEPAPLPPWPSSTKSSLAVRPVESENCVPGTHYIAPSREVVSYEPDDNATSRVVAMEEQLANLSGTVESIMISNDKHSAAYGEEKVANYERGYTPHQQALTYVATKQQLLALRDTARDLKRQLADLKRVQRTNVEDMRELVNEKARDLTVLLASATGVDRHPLRMRRLNADRARSKYSIEATETEKQLSDVEAAVEELRNEVVERRCRVNTKEVEALVLQLSQAGRTIAQLKGAFPDLSAELRFIASAESEAMYAEKNFIDAEPSRLDEQLKRCKQLTATLFTLKKLANVQEARSKTPVPFANARPSTPSHAMRRTGSDVWKDRSRLLADVCRMKVDHERRMESIQEAEVNWNRRRKFICAYDSKKLEKALEVAEKSLKRTDHISQIEQRRRQHLIELYHNRHIAEGPRSLLVSDSSSIESLPPPPPPLTSQGSVKPQSSTTTSIHSSTTASTARPFSNADYVVIARDGANNRGNDSAADKALPFTSSLPRQLRHRGFKGSSSEGPGEAGQGQTANVYGRQTPVQQLERSRSVTPQHWKMRQFTEEFGQMSEHERALYLEQQQIQKAEKTRRLKEQYTKLQILQRKQRMVERKGVPQRRHKGTNIPTSKLPSMETTPKSSDV